MLNTLKKKVDYRLFHVSQVVFYRFIFKQSVPLAGVLAKKMANWEAQRRRGDVPVEAEVWETEFASGKWKYMEKVSELGRYSLIIGYLAYFKPQGSILDVGCGEGILFERYRAYGYSKYLGIDISATAVAQLADRQDDKTQFVQADGEFFESSESVDAIVFNESLYYFHDSIAALERYCRMLNPNGIVIVSTYTGSLRAIAILKQIKTKYPVLDEVTVSHQGGLSWICTVLGQK